MIETIHTLSESFFTKMGIVVESLTVTPEEGSPGTLSIELKTPDSALLIGIHGRTLESIKQLLARMIERTTGMDYRIRLEVNDYMRARDEKLYRFVDRKIEHVLETKHDAAIPNLTSYQRKKVHDYVSEKHIEGLHTYSIGEGTERQIYISLGVATKLDITEDGIGI